MMTDHPQKPKDIERDSFIEEFDEKGYAVREAGFSMEFLSKLRKALLASVEKEAQYVGNKEYNEYGLLLCAPMYGNEYPIFFDVLENRTFLEPMEWILDKWFIMNLYSCSCLPPNGGKIHASRIHVDLPRFIPDYNYGLGVMLCVDDFNKENGGTYFLPGSHKQEDKPAEDFFWENAERIEAKRGQVCYFNPRTWHAAGQNESSDWRVSLLLGVTKPWVKQRLDIPRLLENHEVNVPESVKQVLGFHSQPPSKLSEYFAPKEERSFKQPFV